jgi:hypothetical protein
MSSDLIGLLIPALAFIVIVLLMFGLPALAAVVIKYFKLRERELMLEMEARQKSQRQEAEIEQRMQRLEDAVSSLEYDVRVRLGTSRADLLEAPAAPETEPAAPREPSQIKAR